MRWRRRKQLYFMTAHHSESAPPRRAGAVDAGDVSRGKIRLRGPALRPRSRHRQSPRGNWHGRAGGSGRNARGRVDVRIVPDRRAVHLLLRCLVLDPDPGAGRPLPPPRHLEPHQGPLGDLPAAAPLHRHLRLSGDPGLEHGGPRRGAGLALAREQLRSAVGFSVADEITKLEALETQGSITEDEFQRLAPSWSESPADRALPSPGAAPIWRCHAREVRRCRRTATPVY